MRSPLPHNIEKIQILLLKVIGLQCRASPARMVWATASSFIPGNMPGMVGQTGQVWLGEVHRSSKTAD
jgi:hypothetical protein